MKSYHSRFGYALAILYCLGASYFAFTAYHCEGSSFVRCDISIFIITLPAAWLWYVVFKVQEYNFIEPQAGDVVEVALLILLCAMMFYFIGYLLEYLYRVIRGQPTQTGIR